MKVTNKTSDQDQIKICLYLVGDPSQWIPVGTGVFMLSKGQTYDWYPPKNEEKPEYHLKAFKPGLIDGLLCEKNYIGVNATVEIVGGNGKYDVLVS